MKEKIITFCLLTALLFSCKEDEHEPLVKNDNKPGVLTNLEVENIPGGAKISYTLPDDQDLLYVLARFSSKSGQERIVKSSLYKNFVLLDGFADTNEYVVNLHAVNRSENQSDPVVINIHPLTPPIQKVFESLIVREDFGGINYSFENELEAEYVFHTLIKDDEDNWKPYDKLYSKARSREYSVRGLPPLEAEFGIYISDKWTNKSDTLVTILTPLYEERLDKTLWKVAPLPSDYFTPTYGNRPVSKLWDDKHGIYDYFIAAPPPSAPPLPNWFTIDLGKEVKLSRMKIHQYEGNKQYAYTIGNPKKYEIWGSNDPSDDWSSWTLLLECESIKPSGLPLGSRTDEDVNYALAGEDFTFPVNKPSYRYIRFKLLETWGRVDNVCFDEITLWGQ